MERKLDKHSRYLLNQSPLFKLRTRRKLASLFNLQLSELESLARRQDNYRVFTIGKRKNKPRQVETPKPQIERIHRRLFNLLTRIKSPMYLHSGVKGRSYITNAQAHIGNARLVKLDIKKFFPSTKGWHIYEFFHEIMCCSPDVAGLLVKLTTFKDHIPTGSCISQILAFYSHYRMFEEIKSICSDRKLVVTCYVDDITISGNAATDGILFQVRGLIRRRSLESHKESVYLNRAPRKVTGTIVTDDGLRQPNIKHQQIHLETLSLLEQGDSIEKLEGVCRTLGRAIAGAQADPQLNTRVEVLTQERNRLRNLLDKRDVSATDNSST